MAHALLFPILFLVGTDRLVEDPAVLAFFAALVKDAGYGWFDTERAAFIVAGDDDQYRCVAWKTDRTLRRQTFYGAMPHRTVAIVHTHPRSIPYPSIGDRQTAVRLSTPIFVLTPRNIAMVTPDGEKVWIIRDRWWAPNADASRPSARDRSARQP